ncbi:hypothetical protein D3C86_2000540 [compost metagenome]|jgi:hypothetical protein
MPVIKTPELTDFPVTVNDSDRRAAGDENVAQVSRDGKTVVVLARTQDSAQMKIREASGMKFERCIAWHCPSPDLVDFFDFN